MFHHNVYFMSLQELWLWKWSMESHPSLTSRHCRLCGEFGTCPHLNWRTPKRYELHKKLIIVYSKMRNGPLTFKVLTFITFFIFSGITTINWFLGQNASKRSRSASNSCWIASSPIFTASWSTRVTRSPHETIQKLAHLVSSAFHLLNIFILVLKFNCNIAIHEIV